ncbi:hypothetical protein PGB34_00540 [Xenophilus arseniciresistens]|uniref:Transmembrane protein n=2 Tax=Xenophilus arseniciresistens TaxID=1283306 RepID=A0AAE3N6G7_9BURK|nr:DUF6622 family protein [Xenophilus arseniciresistens]MDA7414837.1 hypothetical protein [Xenophilus arseniciresistens]
MLIQILLHTPAWVFVLFAALLWLGTRQLSASAMPLWRVTAMPVAMVMLAVYGVVTAFGHSPAGLGGLLCWALAAAAVAQAVQRRPLHEQVRYDAATRRVQLPGSWVPLLLIMGIFLTKYGVGVLLALHPGYARHATFALGISTLYGLFSGLFAGRALRLWRLVRRSRTTTVPAGSLSA